MLFDTECMEHGKKYVKHIVDMSICPNAMKYMMRLAIDGEMPLATCEKCVIEWICGDALVECVDESANHTQCTRPVSFWVEMYESCIKSHLACESDEKYIVPIDFTQHVVKIKKIMVEHEANPKNHHAITEYIKKDMEWLQNDTDFSDPVMMVDAMHSFGLIG